MSYEFSDRAKSDIDVIFDYGEQQFGYVAATDYIVELFKLCELIVAHPEMGRVADVGPPGTRQTVHRSHSVYYTIEPDIIYVHRILGTQDIGSAF